MQGEKLHLISVDIGTTHVKAVLYRHEQGIIAQESEQISTYYPKPGWVEQDPDEIFQAVIKIISRLMLRSEVNPISITGLVFSCILQSLIPVDYNGNALCRVSTWADVRSSKQNEELRKRLDPEAVKQRTGCTLHPMYFPSRIAWIKEQDANIFNRAYKFISVKEYVIARLFGEYCIDYSVASGTGIWNMHTCDWDKELLAEIGVDPDKFSKSIEPITVLKTGLKKEYADRLGLLEGTPGIIGAFDGAQSHLGSLGTSEERISLTVGTGAALRKRMTSPAVIPGSEAWCYYLAEGNWLLGGVVHNAGNAMRWFADQLMDSTLSIDQTFMAMNKLASEIKPGAEGLIFLPLFSGDRCPHYRPDAKGVMMGLTFSHGRGHLVRSLMEGLAYHLYSVYKMLDPETKSDLVATGGILKSPVWLGIVADLFGKVLYLPEVDQTTAWGGVLLGLRALGEVHSLDEIAGYIKIDGMQVPNEENKTLYRQVISCYDEAYAKIFEE